MAKKFSINDPIHNRITLSEVEQSVINHRIYQRLRRIKALGLLEKVFPSARHSRFEHSIGACHVAGEILKALLQNHAEISDLSKWDSKDQHKPWLGITEFLDERRIQQIRLAALLHDVGHGPFSHASEDIMPKLKLLIQKNKLPPYVEDALKEKAKKEKTEDADHEDFSLILAWTILTGIEKDHSFLDENYIQDVLAFKFDHVMPSNPANKIIFDLFRVFVSGEFDSDRMDYLLRDSYFCGVPYGKYDLVRLLEGLYVLEKKSKHLVLGVKRTSLSAFEDFLFARFQMHSQVYSHRIDGLFNSAMSTLANMGRRLPAEIDKYAEVDDESFLLSPHMKSSVHLNSLLLNREKWSLVYEATSPKNDKSNKLFNAISKKAGKGLCCLNKSERPLRKPAVLKLPVVKVDRLSGLISTEKLAHIALILKKYDAIFFARRIFVHPKRKNVAVKIVEKLTLMKTKKRIKKVSTKTKISIEKIAKNRKQIAVIEKGKQSRAAQKKASGD